MNAIIIEDELLAQAKLENMLLSIDDSIRVLAKLGSVKDSLQWLSQHSAPDIAFVDIQLSDDHSFEIFRRHAIQFPIIFTTAFDKYLLESFEFNSIDYLLKPISEEKLKRSLEKLNNLKRHFLQENVVRLLNQNEQTVKKERIIAKQGTALVAIALNEIAYFYTEHKIVFLKDFSGKRLIVDKNLGELEAELRCENFFRINRKFLVHPKAIDRFKSDHGKILVFLNPGISEDVYVSKETAPEFRKWIKA